MIRLSVLLLCLWISVAQAAVEYRQFDNAEQEQAYQNLISELRCLVCQNQTIADSNADLAKDLRRQVYEMLQQGKSEQDIVDFMTQRYGDFVMYRPPLKAKTLFLWIGPLLFVVIGLAMLLIVSRRKRSVAEAGGLTGEKKAKIDALLEEGDDS
ncbi:cytochrome c-type biogenesis protein [Methylomarinum sp. Ch1-1]|uniref:Cytochrome c-type biogenesis protein n=1 Tax=Methylomarinum roseum TaxID=3067653 RepID=A0AAU7NR75_9GAMM